MQNICASSIIFNYFTYHSRDTGGSNYCSSLWKLYFILLLNELCFQTVKVDDEESLDEDPRKVEDPVRSKDDKENEKPAMKLKHTSSTDAKDSSNVDDDKKGKIIAGQ